MKAVDSYAEERFPGLRLAAWMARIAPVPFLIALLLSSVGGLCAGLMVAYVSRVVDAFASGSEAYVPTLLLGLFLLMQTILPVISGVLGREGGRVAVLRYRAAFIDRLAAETDLERFSEPEFHGGIQSARMAIDSAVKAQTTNIAAGIAALVGVASVAVVLSALDILAVVVLITSLLPLWVADRAIARRQVQMMEDAGLADRERMILEHMAHQQTVAYESAVYRGWPLLRGKYLAASRRYFGAERSMDVAFLRLEVLRGVVIFLTLLGAVLLAGNGTNSGGEGAALVTGVLLVIQSSGVATQSLVKIHQAGLQMIMFDRNLPTPLPSSDSPAPLRPKRITLRNVWFKYDEHSPWVFTGIDLTFMKGQFNVIVGPNGAGKSTLAGLICGFLKPTIGAVEWDEIDISDIDNRQLWLSIALMVQDCPQYEYSLRDVIALGRDDIREPDILDIVDKVGLQHLISAEASPLDAMLAGASFVGAEGRRLSGGEWQRISLARALVEPRGLLVADEPNSALDPDSEVELVQALRAKSRDGIGIMVSHRLGALQRRDQITLLVDGQISAVGEHHQLWASSDEYQDLVGSQMQAASRMLVDLPRGDRAGQVKPLRR